MTKDQWMRVPMEVALSVAKFLRTRMATERAKTEREFIGGVCDVEFGGGEGVAESDSVAPLTDGDPTAQVPDEEG